MLLLLLLFSIIFSLSESYLESSQEVTVNQVKKNRVAHGIFHTYMTPLSKPSNLTHYFESENILRIPKVTNTTEQKNSKKMLKKTPKRTIQRIIKKVKSKNRRMYMNQMTSMPTQPSSNVDLHENYAKDDKLQRFDAPTTHVTQRKKSKKYSNTRNHKLYQNLLSKMELNTRRRKTREVDRNDMYILEDLDEIDFLSKEDGNEVVRAHVKKYW